MSHLMLRGCGDVAPHHSENHPEARLAGHHLRQASGARSSGIVSIVAAMPLRALNLSVASPVAGLPVRAPSILRLPNSKSIAPNSRSCGLLSRCC